MKRVLSKIQKREPDAAAVGGGDHGKKLLEGIASKFPMLRRRRKLVVIALDCYDDKGNPEKKMVQYIQEIMKAVRLDPQTARVSGFALSTAMHISKTVEFLTRGKIQVNEFDALICSSGSEVYYPGTYAEDGKLLPDPDYASHIEYRWGCDGLKKTIWKLCASEGEENPIEEDTKSSNSHCISYLVKDLSKVSVARITDINLTKICTGTWA